MSKSESRLQHAVWRKSSRSEGMGDCVEVTVDYWVGVRDSKNPEGPVLWYTGAEWVAFLEGVKRGEFDLR
ncbi:DUF397 domain-containing protein [Actinomadura parmotrematis]|uniref:DUF397 domain-containing protein n=1 Tax=Actinomadura parmotrematis TaxID=2864039 RepID=A0ABS7G2R1_9ACTN|nr:DUF397 domain-containing protein [Actinomadura parmotrematis]MBW8485933.1 DUF397 domain-containing protein [Actinomadura parmotrematis]